MPSPGSYTQLLDGVLRADIVAVRWCPTKRDLLAVVTRDNCIAIHQTIDLPRKFDTLHSIRVPGVPCFSVHAENECLSHETVHPISNLVANSLFYFSLSLSLCFLSLLLFCQALQFLPWFGDPVVRCLLSARRTAASHCTAQRLARKRALPRRTVPPSHVWRGRTRRKTTTTAVSCATLSVCACVLLGICKKRSQSGSASGQATVTCIQTNASVQVCR